MAPADASQEFNAYSSDSEVDPQDTLFTEAGQPVRFFLHESLSQKKRASAVDAIDAYGGLVTLNHDEAQIVLVEEKHLECSFDILEARYGCHRDEKIRNIEVYRYSQLKTWIDSGRFTIRKIRYKRRIPGRKLTSRRVMFTEEDDKNLARYLADNTFQNGSLGRLGHTLYRRLMEMATPGDDRTASGYSWAGRHPADSWRERYRKNQKRMNALIRHYAKERHREDGKGSIWYTDDPDEVRLKVRRKGVRVEVIKYGEDEESELDELEEEEDEEATRAEIEAQFTPAKKKRKRSADGSLPGRAKRRREESVPSIEVIEHSRRTPKKGKEKAKQIDLEESPDRGDEDEAGVFENAYGENDMHYDDEPGPSYTQHSPALPSPTLAEPSQPARQRTRTSSIPPNTNTQPPSGSVPVIFSSPAQASPGRLTRERARDAAARAQASLSHKPVQDKSNAVNVPIPVASKKGRAARKIASNSTRAVDPMVLQPRMTRARSRSVDPTAAENAQKASTKAKGKKKAISLAPLGEEDDDLVASDHGVAIVIPDDNTVHSVSGNSAQTGVEEDAVDDILNEDDKDDIEESEDDAQTRRVLENPTGKSATADDQETNEDSDEELARRLQDEPRPPLLPKSKPAQLESPAKIDLATVHVLPANRKQQQPPLVTPLTRRTRAGRTAAKQAAAAPILTRQRKVFPSPGTKASEVMDRWDEASKREEYQPPLGTKARELRQRR